MCGFLIASAIVVPSAPAAARALQIVALGDSLTAGLGLPAGQSFVDLLQKALRAKGYDVAIENAGVSGDTAADGLARLDWAIPDGADAAIVELGANDMLRGLDPDATEKALGEILARLQARHITTLLAGMRAALAGWHFDPDRIRPAVAPTIPHHCSDEFILGCAALAREYGCALHSHVAESKVQAVSGMRLYGLTQTAHLDRLGVLGPHFTVAHGVWLDDEDMRRLGDRGASVAHNPGSNMRLGSGIADARAMLERRVNLGIGTDGANCSDNQNMYEAMRLASFASKVRGPDWRRWLTTREVALAATEGGARALGFAGRIGRLAPGYKADIVMLDLDHPNWIPLNDPVNQLVHSEDGGAVASVMIGGRLIVDTRRLLTVDLAQLGARAEAARERLAAANADHRRLYQALEPVVGSHCPGLARLPYHIHRYGAPLD